MDSSLKSGESFKIDIKAYKKLHPPILSSCGANPPMLPSRGSHPPMLLSRSARPNLAQPNVTFLHQKFVNILKILTFWGLKRVVKGPYGTPWDPLIFF